MNYYNEHDPKAAAWLRELISANLIAPGEVDERSIVDVAPGDVRGFAQCHWFAGIGGWSYALRLAAWPDDRPVWTGSCPCQPFSCAGKQRGTADERHLWPEFARLIRECRPKTIFGEQVASAEVIGTQQEADFVDAVSRGDYAAANKLAKRLATTRGFHYFARWLDGVCDDLEAIGYRCWADDLPAASVGAPHIRQRLYWVANAQHAIRRPQHGPGQDECNGHDAGREEAHRQPGTCCEVRGMADSDEPGCDERSRSGQQPIRGQGAGLGGVGDANDAGPQGRVERDGSARELPLGSSGAWSRYDILPCRDGKARRVESGTFPLAHGIPARVVRLRGYGNAIVPQVAAEFIRAAEESLKCLERADAR